MLLQLVLRAVPLACALLRTDRFSTCLLLPCTHPAFSFNKYFLHDHQAFIVIPFPIL